MPASRTTLLHAWIDAALEQMGASDARSRDTIFISTLSRIHGMLGPQGAWGAKMRGWHDAYCALKLESKDAQLEALTSLRAMTAADLSAGAGAGARDPFKPKLVAEHCSMDAAIADHLAGEQFAGALAAAQYGPAYVLAWTDVPAELQPLLAVPLDLSDPLARIDAKKRAASIAAVVKDAKRRWPKLAIDVAKLDFSAAHAFARTYARALKRASFAKSAGRSRRSK